MDPPTDIHGSSSSNPSGLATAAVTEPNAGPAETEASTSMFGGDQYLPGASGPAASSAVPASEPTGLPFFPSLDHMYNFLGTSFGQLLPVPTHSHGPAGSAALPAYPDVLSLEGTETEIPQLQALVYHGSSDGNADWDSVSGAGTNVPPPPQAAAHNANSANTTTTNTAAQAWMNALQYDISSTSQVFFPTPPEPMYAMNFGGGGPLIAHNLHPTNADLTLFLTEWCELMLAKSPDIRTPTMIPMHSKVNKECERSIDEVSYSELRGDDCDFQGIRWSGMGVTRAEARVLRQRKYANYCTNNSDQWKPLATQVMPHNTESYFRFKKMKIKKQLYLAHFQLRHLLAAPCKSRVLYADAKGAVRQYNAVTGKTDLAMVFPSDQGRVQISTLAAGEGVLVAGGLEGNYGISRIEPTHGGGEPFRKLKDQEFKKIHVGISNHIQVYRSRNGGGPVAALASNDSRVRVMDIATQKILADSEFPFPINCSAVSPDGRLRIVVGDIDRAYVVAAETERGSRKPNIVQTLSGHMDYGFACAWAEDGYTMATGNQDRAVKIWDARKTSTASGTPTPVATLRTVMSSVRSLHFSPAGSGKRVLVAAEETDVVNIIDAQTFQKRQAFDVFGELAGVGFSDDGQDMFALCTDPTRGGILHFERTGILSNAANYDETPLANQRGFSSYDWPAPFSKTTPKQRNRDIQRRLRAAARSGMEAF